MTKRGCVLSRHTGFITFVIPAQAGTQLTPFVVNLCHLALLRKLILRINWIPRVRGMTMPQMRSCLRVQCTKDT